MRLTFGRFLFDSRLRVLTSNGAKLELSPKGLLLLETLIEARGAPVPREVLYDRLWPETFVEAGNLHNLVSEIRRALGDEAHQLLRTIHGVGYLFDARDIDIQTGGSDFVLWNGDKAFELPAGETIIGRDPTAAIVIDSADVSRQHVRLFVSGDHVTIEDLGSKNGTFIASQRLTSSRILHGMNDQIVLGKTHLCLRRRGNVDSTVTTI